MDSNQNGNRQGGNQGDRAWPGAVQWRMGGAPTGEFVWRCDAMRAGSLYNRMMFDTRAEAEEFARKMRQHEPDQMFNVEAIKASTIWN